jgi:hypothetical protein
MDEKRIARFVQKHDIGLVGIGAMTRMIAKAYRMADAIRKLAVQVVMGGPHVTEIPAEALGRDGGRCWPPTSRRSAPPASTRTWPSATNESFGSPVLQASPGGQRTNRGTL